MELCRHCLWADESPVSSLQSPDLAEVLPGIDDIVERSATPHSSRCVSHLPPWGRQAPRYGFGCGYDENDLYYCGENAGYCPHFTPEYDCDEATYNLILDENAEEYEKIIREQDE